MHSPKLHNLGTSIKMTYPRRELVAKLCTQGLLSLKMISSRDSRQLLYRDCIFMHGHINPYSI